MHSVLLLFQFTHYNDDYSNLSVTLGCFEFTPLFMTSMLSLLYFPFTWKTLIHRPGCVPAKACSCSIRYYSTYQVKYPLSNFPFSLFPSSLICSLLFVHFTLFFLLLSIPLNFLVFLLMPLTFFSSTSTHSRVEIFSIPLSICFPSFRM